MSSGATKWLGDRVRRACTLARALGHGSCGAGLLLLAIGCAGTGTEIHLEPVYSRYATGDGATETDSFLGLLRTRSGKESVWEDFRDLEGDYESVTLGPIVSRDRRPDGSWLLQYAVPLGFTAYRKDETISVFVPLYVWTREPFPEGGHEWKLAALPGLLMRSNLEGTQAGWFPLIGRFEDLFTYDRIVFILWPLFVYAERGEAVSYHFFYPFLGWTRGGGESSFHLLPFYGRAKIENRYDRTYFLWPIFHFNRNHLGGGNEAPEFNWMIFPLIGRTTRGTYEGTTWLWPLFGYARDPRSDFWALDFPFPLVRLQRGPDGLRRTRIWPLYSHLEAEGLNTTSFLWPIFHVRKEESTGGTRDAVYVIPLWQSWNFRDRETGERSKWRKLLPVYQYERRGEWRRGSFPTLDPFWRNAVVDRHYSWLWKLFEWEEEGPMRRERVWGALYRREKDAGEDRKNVSGLWASRRYRADGRRVKETSLLFGLLRWRVTEGEGFDMLPIAFPGPGWPLERVRAPGEIEVEGEIEANGR